jgi:hypothetical protein
MYKEPDIAERAIEFSFAAPELHFEGNQRQDFWRRPRVVAVV